MQSKSKNIELILPFLCKKCPVFNLILCIGIFVEQFIIFVKICTMNDTRRVFQPMTIKSVVDMLEEINFKVEGLVVRERLGINLNLCKSLAPRSILEKLNVPYLVQDNRMLRVISGQVVIEVNFTEYTVTAGDILFIKEGSYFEVIDLSDDFKGEVIAFLPEQYNSRLLQRDRNAIHIHLENEEWEKISHLIYSVYTFAADVSYRKDVVEPLVISLFNSIILMSEDRTESPASTGTEHLFEKFMDKLQENSSGKHSVSYYADLLCVTPQYLSKAVSLTSGKTVSEWISKAVITEAKVLLKDTGAPVADISETLNFPTDSFFCRFFKKETGMTPTQYRKS